MDHKLPEKIKITGMEEYYVFQGESGALLIEMAMKINEIISYLERKAEEV